MLDYTFTLLMVALVAILGAQSTPLSEASKCQLQDSIPEPRAEVKNVASMDNSTIANFDGYLIYHMRDGSSRDRYLPLNLVKVSMPYIAAESRTMILDFDCANMQLYLVHICNYANADMDGIIVVLQIPNGDSDSCHMGHDALTSMSYPPGNHYQCPKKQSYECKLFNEKNPLVTLVANKFEFELEGNYQIISKGQFSKPAAVCQ